MPYREAGPKAKAAAEKALEFDDALADAHTALGWVRLFYDWNWPEAEREFQCALELNPGYSSAHMGYAYYLAVLRRHDRAIAAIRRAQEHDPFSLAMRAGVAEHLYFARQYAEAIQQLHSALELDPGFAWSHVLLSRAYREQGMYEQAIAASHEAGLSTQSAASLRAAFVAGGPRAYWRWWLSQRREQAKRRHIAIYRFAPLHAALGEIDQAFECLEKACQQREGPLVFLGIDPRLDPLRDDPRFDELLRRIGLEPSPVSSGQEP